MENCNFVIVISSFQGSSASPPPTPTKMIVAVLYSSLVDDSDMPHLAVPS